MCNFCSIFAADLKKYMFIVLALLSVVTASATMREEAYLMVDSAYALAMSGDVQRAVAINNDALSSVPEDSMDIRCEFYSCLLYCYHRLGEYEEALRYGELCLQYDEQSGTPEDLSASLGNLAGIYSSAGRQDVAEDYLRRSIRIEEQLLQADTAYSPKSLAIRQAMLGEVLLAKSKELEDVDKVAMLSEALRLTNEALVIDRRLGRRVQEGMRLAQTGHIYEALGQQKRAREYAEEALDIARETGNKMTEVLCLLQLGQYEEAAQRAHECGFKKQEYEACDKLYLQAKNAGKSAEALRWLEQTRTLYTALQSEESERHMTASAVKYDTFRKEQQLAAQEQAISAQQTRTRVLTIIILLATLIVLLLVVTLFLLRRRKQTVEQASRYREQQYRILAHDLTNPMVAQQQVQRMLYLDSSHYTPEQMHKALGQLLSASESQLMLLKNLSEFTRFDHGSRHLQPARLDLNGLAADAINAMRSIAELKEVKLVNSAEHIYVKADRDSLRTVLRNLISNAVKFSPAGAAVEIGTLPPNCFFVRDHGTGISGEKIAELLQATSRVESTIGTNGETGTGLGLLLCRELLRLNKGVLRIESTPGKGTTAICELKE